MGRFKKRIISIVCIAWMVFLPFGSIYAAVDCMFHDDSEHISHGVEIASDYTHSHDTFFLDANEQLILSSAGLDLGDSSVEKFIDSHCSSGLVISVLVNDYYYVGFDWKDPFSDAYQPISLATILNPLEIRPPISV